MLMNDPKCPFAESITTREFSLSHLLVSIPSSNSSLCFGPVTLVVDDATDNEDNTSLTVSAVS
jgi:hypothetical protein